MSLIFCTGPLFNQVFIRKSCFYCGLHVFVVDISFFFHNDWEYGHFFSNVSFGNWIEINWRALKQKNLSHKPNNIGSFGIDFISLLKRLTSAVEIPLSLHSVRIWWLSSRVWWEFSIPANWGDGLPKSDIRNIHITQVSIIARTWRRVEKNDFRFYRSHLKWLSHFVQFKITQKMGSLKWGENPMFSFDSFY